ncbi:hypothetical protein ACIQGT_25480 [Streptomyces sp. NPDC093108]|uniref:hypothetical protein n=1 Tax=Streptomyces sp. NPDC093108 TaxID=3366030 RepID=UPI00380CFD8E
MDMHSLTPPTDPAESGPHPGAEFADGQLDGREPAPCDRYPDFDVLATGEVREVSARHGVVGHLDLVVLRRILMTTR